MKVRRRVADRLYCGEGGGVNKPPGLILDKDRGNEVVFTYVELRRGGREMAAVKFIVLM
jgi:hypothetical protein